MTTSDRLDALRRDTRDTRRALRGRPDAAQTAPTQTSPTRGRTTSDPRRTVLLVAVGIALLLVGMRIEIALGLKVGTVAAMAAAPAWLPVLARFRGARIFMAAGLLAMLSGVWLTELSSVDHTVTTSLLIGNIFLIVELLSGVGLILWARQLMSDARIAIWFGVGLLLGVNADAALYAESPWKFGFSTGATVVLLGIAQARGSRWLEIAALVVLIAASAVSDARSSFAILVLALVLTVWQLRPSRPSRRVSAIWFVLSAAVVVIIVYNVGQALILDGYLGDAARERSVEQIDASGSLILGGRPELAATVALMLYQPWGFGAGIVPTLSDITAAKTGMAAIGYAPNNGYVEGYMFGYRFELHSVIGDLWANFGIPGLAFAAVMLVLIGVTLARGIPSSVISALVLYLAVRGGWNLLFGPLYGSVPLLILLFGLLLVRRGETVGELPYGRRRVRPPRR
ncbi:O-antigen ligase family protein [Marisediminicola senii]|uniref:O-antigen ligase family protein n=1 Tax=Marisediminicola senii TaxID=2711233 RepID=UPI0013EB6B37|nr:O-antigen ligase family protein [Marisediminicola senii]